MSKHQQSQQQSPKPTSTTTTQPKRHNAVGVLLYPDGQRFYVKTVAMPVEDVERYAVRGSFTQERLQRGYAVRRAVLELEHAAQDLMLRMDGK